MSAKYSLTSPSHASKSKLSTVKKAIKEGKGCVVLWHAHWCGHCQAFMPEWRVFMDKSTGSVVVVEIEHAVIGVLEKEDPQLFKELGGHKVQGFPTVMSVKKGVQTPYSGARTAAGLNEHVKAKFGERPASAPARLRSAKSPSPKASRPSSALAKTAQPARPKSAKARPSSAPAKSRAHKGGRKSLANNIEKSLMKIVKDFMKM